jgi:hypothetical protein
MSDSKGPPFSRHRAAYIVIKIALLACAVALGLRLAGVM